MKETNVFKKPPGTGNVTAADVLSSVLHMQPKDRPAFIFLSAALWHLRWNGPLTSALDKISKNLKILHPIIKNITSTTHTRVIWILQDPLKMVFLPTRFKSMGFSNPNLLQMDKRSQETLAGSGAYILKSTSKIT